MVNGNQQLGKELEDMLCERGRGKRLHVSKDCVGSNNCHGHGIEIGRDYKD